MQRQWGLIANGFVVAGLGAAASMLYIVSLSAAYVGRYALAAGAIAAGLAGAWLFRILLPPYLDQLEARLGGSSEPPATRDQSTANSINY
ncbi:MAG: hypothetical protein IT424_15460 [Pirellulales bacterium]|nr:hypothetical protein [Pirellulales bacterium]